MARLELQGPFSTSVLSTVAQVRIGNDEDGALEKAGVAEREQTGKSCIIIWAFTVALGVILLVQSAGNDQLVIVDGRTDGPESHELSCWDRVLISGCPSMPGLTSVDPKENDETWS